MIFPNPQLQVAFSDGEALRPFGGHLNGGMGLRAWQGANKQRSFVGKRIYQTILIYFGSIQLLHCFQQQFHNHPHYWVSLPK